METRPRSEHALTAWVGIAAMLAAGLVIFSAYLELNGIGEIEVALAGTPQLSAGAPIHASLQSWATGFQ